VTRDARRYEATAVVAAPVEDVFAFLDNHENLASHMSKPSGRMFGSAMTIWMDPDRTQRVGSRFGFTGSVLGIPLRVVEVVMSREPPHRKTWETSEEPTLWVIGRYGMGFALDPLGQRSRLSIHISYVSGPGLLRGFLGLLFGRSYARWCVGRMLDDAVGHFTRTGAEPA
jgi:hypothetical protein